MIAETDTADAHQRPAVRSLERPVFLDETGRRARVVRLSGQIMGAATALWLVALVLGASAPLALPSLRSQLATMHASGSRTVATGRIIAHSPDGQLDFVRLTTAPHATPTTAHHRVAADVEARVGRTA